MIIDASALIAILRAEPDAERFARAIERPGVGFPLSGLSRPQS
jgi:uncharacterized protein with PIN domain